MLIFLVADIPELEAVHSSLICDNMLLIITSDLVADDAILSDDVYTGLRYGFADLPTPGFVAMCALADPNPSLHLPAANP